MADALHTALVEASDVAGVLNAMAELMEAFHASDIALQSALSTLASHAREAPGIGDLQHVDLLTQVHCDLARLLPALAACLEGTQMQRDALKGTLTLRSLQDGLIERTGDDDRPEAGEVSLF